MDLLEKLFIMEGIFLPPQTEEGIELAVRDVTARTITDLHQAVENLKEQLDEVEIMGFFILLVINERPFKICKHQICPWKKNVHI